MTALTENRHARILRLLRAFNISAGLIFIITGLAKLVVGFSTVKLLTTPDPVLGWEFKHLMLTVGIAEVIMALICFFLKRSEASLFLVAWFASAFLLYRVGLWWVDPSKPCSCMGNLTDALHLSPATANTLMKIVLAYLFAGSYFLLYSQRRRGSAGVKL